MADGALQIDVKGAAKSAGELKKVAGGYKSIGSAASSASNDVEKLEKAENKLERRTKRRVGDRADLFGKFGGGLIKQGGNNVAQMGAVGLVATVATAAIGAITSADDRAVERAGRINDEMQTFANAVRTSTAALEANAAATVRAQSANDRREFNNKDQKTFTKVDAMRKEVDDRAKTRLAENALEGQRKEVFASRNPNLALALPQVEAMRQKLEDQDVKATAQGGFTGFMKDFLPEGNEKTKLWRMQGEFNEASSRLLNAATALDRAANSRSASLPSP